jgi:hypothetical protein
MSTKMQVEWHRANVLELLSKDDSQSDIEDFTSIISLTILD